MIYLFLMAALPLAAQPLRVYSEFSRISPSGEVVEMDRSEADPREILSPAVPRNGFASFHIVASIPAGKPFIFTIGQNPEDAVAVTMYREVHDEKGIPDKLEPITLPFEATAPESGQPFVFWLDMWTDSNAPVRRIKVEPQLHIEGYWYTYPMEVRISPPVVPAFNLVPWALATASARADADAQPAVRGLLCSVGPLATAVPATPTVRSLMQRNLQQDMALARDHYPREMTFKVLLDAAKVKTAADWCNATKSRATSGLNAEWFLKVRDFLYRAALN